MKTNQLEIRGFKKNDKDAVFKLHVEAMKSTGENIDPRVFDDFKDIESIYILPGGDFLVGTIEGEIVAIGAIKKVSNSIGEIKRMRVDPIFQKQGFGQTLLERLEQRARELGFNCLQLDTSVAKETARRLYEKNGYIEYKQEVVAGIPCIFYRKML